MFVPTRSFWRLRGTSLRFVDSVEHTSQLRLFFAAFCSLYSRSNTATRRSEATVIAASRSRRPARTRDAKRQKREKLKQAIRSPTAVTRTDTRHKQLGYKNNVLPPTPPAPTPRLYWWRRRRRRENKGPIADKKAALLTILPVVALGMWYALRPEECLKFAEGVGRCKEAQYTLSARARSPRHVVYQTATAPPRSSTRSPGSLQPAPSRARAATRARARRRGSPANFLID